VNNRQGKILISAWLLPEEERILLESFENGLDSSAWLILKEVYKRGDIIKR
jgi:hypothetical protein